MNGTRTALLRTGDLEILRASAGGRTSGQQIPDHARGDARVLLGHRFRFGVDDGVDVVVPIGIERLVEPALVFKHRRKPGIVAPVGVDGDGALRLFGPEEIIDRRAQQRKAARAQVLRLIDPCYSKAFQRLYRFSRVILHAAKDDDAVAGRLYLVAIHLEPVAEAEARDLAFDQTLGRLRQRPLRLADAHRQRAPLGLAGLHQKLSEEMRLTRTAPAVQALIAGGREQRLEDSSRWNFQD